MTFLVVAALFMKTGAAWAAATLNAEAVAMVTSLFETIESPALRGKVGASPLEFWTFQMQAPPH